VKAKKEGTLHKKKTFFTNVYIK